MDRVQFRDVDDSHDVKPPCWNCGQPLVGPTAATFLYRRASRAVFEDWRICGCGAYQNAERVREIVIDRSSHV